jgi:amidohydrolase
MSEGWVLSRKAVWEDKMPDKNLNIDKQKLISWRRFFHMHPEISGRERETAAFIAERLQEMGMEVEQDIAGFGVVGILKGDPTKKCVAIRADMDALPITEENNVIYKSQHPGWMHACGHDAHMAMVLGAAEIIVANPPGGTVKFIFQPREEKPPGGAKDMVHEGVLKNPDVNAIFGTHITTLYPAGTIGVFDGAVMAVADDFKLSIFGRGGHGANPHQTIDTITVAAQAIEALQTMRGRRIDPTEAVVLTIGTIHGGTAQNIIPDRVDMTGTLRCFDVRVRDQVLEYMHETLAGITSAWGAGYELDYIYGYPPVINVSRLNWVIEKSAASIPGVEVVHMEKPMMAGEDFSYYMEEVPGVFFFTGAGSERCNRPWHHAQFDIEEEALPIGVQVLALAAAHVAGEDKPSLRDGVNS